MEMTTQLIHTVSVLSKHNAVSFSDVRVCVRASERLKRSDIIIRDHPLL